MKKITIAILTLVAVFLTACAGASTTATEEVASDKEATAIAEVVTTMRAATSSAEGLIAETPAITVTLTSDYENAASILMQVVIGLYQLESTDQAVTAAQAQELLSLFTPLQDTSAEETVTQEQMDALVEQAVSVLTTEQIQVIAAMQITQETTMSVMQELGVSMGGPGQGDGNPPSGDMGGPPQGDMSGGTPPEGGPGGQPPADGQMGAPPTDGTQRGTEFISPELLNAIIEFLQTKIAS